MLTKLCEQWIQYKSDEVAARDCRLAAEKEIIDALGDDLKIGSNKVADMLKVTAGLKREWDNEKLLELRNNIAPDYFPFREELKEVRKLSRAIEEDVPELWGIISKALTIKPEKPSFEVLK